MMNQKKFKQNKLKKQHFIDNRVIPLPGQYIRFLKISVISGNVNFFFLSIFFFKMRKKHTKVLLRKNKKQ